MASIGSCYARILEDRPFNDTQLQLESSYVRLSRAPHSLEVFILQRCSDSFPEFPYKPIGLDNAQCCDVLLKEQDIGPATDDALTECVPDVLFSALLRWLTVMGKLAELIKNRFELFPCDRKPCEHRWAITDAPRRFVNGFERLQSEADEGKQSCGRPCCLHG